MSNKSTLSEFAQTLPYAEVLYASKRIQTRQKTPKKTHESSKILRNVCKQIMYL